MRSAFLYSSFFVLCVAMFFSCVPFQEETPCANEVFMGESKFVDWEDEKPTFELPKGNIALSSFLLDTLAFYQFPEHLSLIPVNLIISEEIQLEIQAINPNYMPPLGTNGRNKVDILVNRHSQILIEQRLVSLDSLSKELINQFKLQRANRVFQDSVRQLYNFTSKANDFHRSIVISIDWDVVSKESFISSVIIRTQEAISKFYEEVAMQYFQKPLCDLDSLELRTVKNFQCVFRSEYPLVNIDILNLPDNKNEIIRLDLD